MTATAAPAPTAADLEEQLARIRRSNAETEKFIAEHRKLNTDATIAPYTALFAAFTAGAAVVGAIAALLKFLSP